MDRGCGGQGSGWVEVTGVWGGWLGGWVGVQGVGRGWGPGVGQ